jgi:hypothetical protein
VHTRQRNRMSSSSADKTSAILFNHRQARRTAEGVLLQPLENKMELHMMRALSGSEVETMPDELYSATEKTVGEGGGAGSAGDELGALAGLEPGGLASVQEVLTTLLVEADRED